MTANSKTKNDNANWSDVQEVLLVGKTWDITEVDLMVRVPAIPQKMLWEFASDVSTVLGARFPNGSDEANLIDGIIYLLTYGNDPIRFAQCAQLYERLGGEFDSVLSGCTGDMREKIAAAPAGD